MTPRRLVIDALAARFGGTAYAAIQTAKQLAHCGTFTEVVVVTRQGSIVANGLEAGGALRLDLLPPIFRAELPQRVLWEAFGLPRDIAGTESTSVLTWSGMLPRRLRAPVTSFISNPLMFQRSGLANWLRRRAMKRTAEGDTRVVAPSGTMATLASAALGIPVAVIPYGVDHARFCPADGPGDEVLCVADFYPHKRHDIVLDAWAGLPSPRPTLRLVGNPSVPSSVHREICARIENYRDLGTIRIDHELGLAQLTAAYRRARVFVIASEHESFCMPLLEALASGVPATARDLPALRETGGAATQYISGDDAQQWSSVIGDLIDDGRLHQRVRQSGIEHASAFTWTRTALELASTILSGSAATER